MSETYELDQRAQRLLKQLITEYTLSAHPVASKNLAKLSGMDISSATIRSIMSKLENLGLVDSPHTSAGRIPTQAGYRFFVDSLLEVSDLDSQAKKTIADGFCTDRTSADLVQHATDILSNITQLTGVVSLTHPTPAEIRYIEFMRLSDQRILVILVINQDEVHNKVIQVDREYSDQELRRATRTLSRYLIGQNFQTARKQLLVELSELKTDVNAVMETVLEAMESVCHDCDSDELLTSGKNHLLQFEELSNINKVRDLFNVFNEKKDLLKLLDSCGSAEGVEIFIGSESGHALLRDCSLIGAPYQVRGSIVGVLGVIGPTRIAYEQVIPAVDLTAKLLSAALNSQK